MAKITVTFQERGKQCRIDNLINDIQTEFNINWTPSHLIDGRRLIDLHKPNFTSKLTEGGSYTFYELEEEDKKTVWHTDDFDISKEITVSATIIDDNKVQQFFLFRTQPPCAWQSMPRMRMSAMTISTRTWAVIPWWKSISAGLERDGS